jgi:peptide/nickel transport system substrate-binding protein
MPDISKANEIIHQMENIILEEAPIVPLYYDEVARFTSKRVKNLPLNAMNLLVLKSVELE